MGDGDDREGRDSIEKERDRMKEESIELWRREMRRGEGKRCPAKERRRVRGEEMGRIREKRKGRDRTERRLKEREVIEKNNEDRKQKSKRKER